MTNCFARNAAIAALTLVMAVQCHGADHPILPDSKLTPGAVDPRVTQDTIGKTICKSGYTKTVRNVPQSMKKEVMQRYGLPESDLHKVEIDHLVSLENGGSNEIENLWPEFYAPSPGAREKDKLETALKRDVCAGRMTLAEDQKILRTNWFAEFQKRYGEAFKKQKGDAK